MNIFLRKSEDRSKPNRRDFLVQSTCAGMGITSMVNTLSHLSLIGNAAAQGSGEDYKALVCLFLNGGNDSSNLLLPSGTPATSTARTQYETARTILTLADSSFDNINYDRGNNQADLTLSSRLTPLNANYMHQAGYCGTGVGSMALSAAAAPLASMFNSGELSFVSNIGTLTQPGITRGNFNTFPKPPQLFSHSDQQTQWQSSIPDKPFTSGWGGRIADLLGPQNAGDLSLSVSIAGVNSLQIGVNVQPYIMSTNGVASYSGFGSPYNSSLRNAALAPHLNSGPLSGNRYDPLANLASNPNDLLQSTNYQNNNAGWRLRALEQVLAMNHASLFDTNYVDVPKNARFTESLVGSALAATATTNTAGQAATTLDSHFDLHFPNGLFNPRLTDFSNQLKMVARLIAGRTALANRRQIFFVQLGGWDTHTSQIPGASPLINGHYGLVNNLARSVNAFADAMKALGLWDKVMLFTASDFNRTLVPNTSGSDHGWGGHAFICGGGVKGRQICGKFPDLTFNGGIDASGNRGRFIPTTPVDVYAGRIAQWFGVPNDQIAAIFPNLSRFVPGGNPANAVNMDFLL